MAIMTVTSTVSVRYFMKKSKDWLRQHISDLRRMLDLPQDLTSTMEAMDKSALARLAQDLHNQLPEDE